jgi:secernin
MCDTLVVSADATRDGSLLFAKNSDREPNEAQSIEIVAEAEHPPGARVRATYVELPEVARTRRMLLSRPFWMWGAEMGANDAGVVIGNEAVFTRVRPGPPALLGMDLLRLALARADSARAALDVMTALLEQWGQGGSAGYEAEFRYDNAFLIADRESAWVLETAGRAWVAARVFGVRAISNGLTLHDDWDLGADGLAARARDAGLSPGKGKLDFARTFARPFMSLAASAPRRRRDNEAACSRAKVAPHDVMRALRRHGSRDDAARALRSPFMTVCAHASWWPTRTHSQTTGSLVSWLGRDDAVHFVTGTSAPCVSSFKPVFLDAGLDPRDARALSPGARYDPRQVWWRHELLHRRALSDLSGFITRFSPERDALERELVDAALGAPSDRRALTQRAFASAADLEARFVETSNTRARLASPFARYWRGLDAGVGVPG